MDSGTEGILVPSDWALGALKLEIKWGVLFTEYDREFNKISAAQPSVNELALFVYVICSATWPN